MILGNYQEQNCISQEKNSDNIYGLYG